MGMDEIESRFRDFAETLAATVEIEERCLFDLPIGKAHIPAVPLPAEMSATEYLRQKAYTGAATLFGEITPDIQSRLDHKSGVIAYMGFEPIFLIVEEILNFACTTGVPICYSSTYMKVSHLHTALAPFLDETFGVILYQEQGLRVAHGLSGFSLAEADLLRRAMSHFDPGKRMQERQRKFVREAESKSGVPSAVGERVWEMMAAFAGNGFPKANSASHAKIAWRSAWLV